LGLFLADSQAALERMAVTPCLLLAFGGRSLLTVFMRVELKESAIDLGVQADRSGDAPKLWPRLSPIG
jgi:hypothetical protein